MWNSVSLFREASSCVCHSLPDVYEWENNVGKVEPAAMIYKERCAKYMQITAAIETHRIDGDAWNRKSFLLFSSPVATVKIYANLIDLHSLWIRAATPFPCLCPVMTSCELWESSSDRHISLRMEKVFGSEIKWRKKDKICFICGWKRLCVMWDARHSFKCVCLCTDREHGLRKNKTWHISFGKIFWGYVECDDRMWIGKILSNREKY